MRGRGSSQTGRPPFLSDINVNFLPGAVMNQYDAAVVTTALEATKILLEMVENGVTDYVLDELDISDEEADVLLDKITELLDK